MAWPGGHDMRRQLWRRKQGIQHSPQAVSYANEDSRVMYHRKNVK